MGLTKPVLRFIAREHRRKPFYGSVLTLGRQGVRATLEDVRQMLAEEQIMPAPLPSDRDTRTNIPSWHETRLKKNTSDVVFFNLLGITDINALDYSSYEHADIIHDLNLPVPAHLRDRFDLIVDGGTLEHVFDVKQSLANIALMLRSGGRIIHISPANNYTNHGFYQFSPTLFFDYYGTNAFIDLRGFIAEHDTYLYDVRPWDVFEMTGKVGQMTSKHSLIMLFVAEKTRASTADRIPVQSLYQQINQPRDNRRRAFSPLAILKQLFPYRVKVFLARNVPFLDSIRKPWRLKRWDRLG
jgi:hypothetical protein